MSDASDGEPRVRPDKSKDSRSTEPRPPATALITAFVAAAAAAAVLFVFFDSDPDTGDKSPPTSLDTSAVTTGPSNAVTTSSGGATDSTVTGPTGGDTLDEFLPDALGSALTVVSGQELVRWTATAPRSMSTIPILNGPVFDFDQSGQHMAFLGPSATTGGSVLYISSRDSWAPAGVGVSSFRWHETDWGRLAWLESGNSLLICTAQVGLDGVLAQSSCVDGVGDEILGFDSEGYVVADGAHRTIFRLDASGRVVHAIAGTDAALGPDGRILVMERSRDGTETTFSMASGDLTGVEVLDWAPQNAAAEYSSFAWSPIDRDGPRIAFLVYDDNGGWQVQLWDSAGTPYGSVDLSGRVWDVSWDNTGRYLLVPGILNESEHTLQVYDTFPESLHQLPFDDWIQDASLVMKASCTNAAGVTAAFGARLPEGIGLGASQMVLSRDATLDSWYFVSALVDGGPSDGAVATWALPGFHERSDVMPDLSIPINEGAALLGFGMTREQPTDYGIDDWYQLDGALASQRCLREITAAS